MFLYVYVIVNVDNVYVYLYLYVYKCLFIDYLFIGFWMVCNCDLYLRLCIVMVLLFIIDKYILML